MVFEDMQPTVGNIQFSSKLSQEDLDFIAEARQIEHELRENIDARILCVAIGLFLIVCGVAIIL
jgi:hypothetical protein